MSKIIDIRHLGNQARIISVSRQELKTALMAVLDQITIGDMRCAVVDADPSISPGLALPIGSIALFNNSGAGYFFLKLGAGDTAWGTFPAETINAVTTSDATVTTIATIPTVTGSTILLESFIEAYRTGGVGGGAVGDSAAFKNTIRIKNLAGVVTLGSNATEYKDSQDGAYAVSIVISSTNVLLQVKGKVGAIIDWNAKTTVNMVT
jgi:hypothetical protein